MPQLDASGIAKKLAPLLEDTLNEEALAYLADCLVTGGVFRLPDSDVVYAFLSGLDDAMDPGEADYWPTLVRGRLSDQARRRRPRPTAMVVAAIRSTYGNPTAGEATLQDTWFPVAISATLPPLEGMLGDIRVRATDPASAQEFEWCDALDTPVGDFIYFIAHSQLVLFQRVDEDAWMMVHMGQADAIDLLKFLDSLGANKEPLSIVKDPATKTPPYLHVGLDPAGIPAEAAAG